MDLSPAKREILEALLLHDKPAKAMAIAKEIGAEFPAVSMHLIGLARAGYASSPQKGTYLIAEKGKTALGLPETTKEKAASILALRPIDRAFHFYADIGKPLNLYAQGLPQFCDNISKVTVESAEFHFARGDFEAWFASIGDVELAKKASLLKNKKLGGEELRQRLREMADNRIKALSSIVGVAAPA